MPNSQLDSIATRGGPTSGLSEHHSPFETETAGLDRSIGRRPGDSLGELDAERKAQTRSDPLRVSPVRPPREAFA